MVFIPIIVRIQVNAHANLKYRISHNTWTCNKTRARALFFLLASVCCTLPIATNHQALCNFHLILIKGSTRCVWSVWVCFFLRARDWENKKYPQRTIKHWICLGCLIRICKKWNWFVCCVWPNRLKRTETNWLAAVKYYTQFLLIVIFICVRNAGMYRLSKYRAHFRNDIELVFAQRLQLIDTGENGFCTQTHSTLDTPFTYTTQRIVDRRPSYLHVATVFHKIACWDNFAFRGNCLFNEIVMAILECR